MASLLDKLSKPLLAGGLAIMPFLPFQREAVAQDFGGLAEKVEKKVERKQAKEYGDLRDYLFREDELPKGYKMDYSNNKIIQAMVASEYPNKKRGIREVVFVEYKNNNEDNVNLNSDTINNFVLVVTAGSNKKYVIHHAIWIRAPGEGYSIYLPYATREGDLSLNIIFSVKLNEEDTNDLKFEDYADNPPILSKKLIDRKPLLKSKVKHILNGIDKIVNRVNGKGVYLIKQF